MVPSQQPNLRPQPLAQRLLDGGSPGNEGLPQTWGVAYRPQYFVELMAHPQPPGPKEGGLKGAPCCTKSPPGQKVGWLEILIDDFLSAYGDFACLDQLSARYPLAFHGVSMSLGSADPLNFAYLARLRDAVARYRPWVVSDHLCWVSQGGRYQYDLLPLPRNRSTADYVVDRIKAVQDFLGCQIAVENIAYYAASREDALAEPVWLIDIVTRADCALLLDLNNLHVNATNWAYDPFAFLTQLRQGLPPTRFAQIHLAGYEEVDGLLIDTHNQPVASPVHDLWASFTDAVGFIPTCVEWDANVPPLVDVLTALRPFQQAAFKDKPSI